MPPNDTERSSASEVPSYSDLSPFVRLLKNRGRVKMLDALLRRPASELSSSELADLANVSEATVSRNKDVLLDGGIIRERRGHGRALFSLNENNEVVQVLIEFHSELLSHYEAVIRSTEPRDDQLLGLFLDAVDTTVENDDDGAARDEDKAAIKAAYVS